MYYISKLKSMIKNYLFLFIAFTNLYIFSVDCFSQNPLRTDTIKSNRADIVITNPQQGQSASIFKDTVLFEENFDKLLQYSQITSNSFFPGNSLMVLPNMFTEFPECKIAKIQARNDTSILSNVTNIFFSESGALFRSPSKGFPQGSILSFNIKTGGSKSTIIINETDTLKLNSSTLKQHIDTLNSYKEYIEIRKESGGSFTIDNLVVKAPQRILIEQDNYQMNDGIISVNGLEPSTKYYVEITNQDGSLSELKSFTTPSKIHDIKTSALSMNSVELSWKNETDSALQIRVEKITNGCDDLMFSQVVANSSNNILEIYNGTGEDVCLKDYKIDFVASGYYPSPANIYYTFTEKDTVRNDSCIILSNRLYGFSGEPLLCFPVVPISTFLAGDDTYVLLKKDGTGDYSDTLDIVGRIKTDLSEDLSSLEFPDKILVRKPNIRTGVKSNPALTDAQNIMNTQWNHYSFGADTLNLTLGRHDSDFIPQYQDAYPTLSMPNETESVLIEGLDSAERYRAIFTMGGEKVASVVFETGRETRAVNSGEWTDPLTWNGHALPKSNDKVVIPKGYTVTIPSGKNVSCAEVELHSDHFTADTTGKAQLILSGGLSTGRFRANISFAKYTADTNGWNLFGLPIDALSRTREETASMFDRDNEDDLYYLNESEGAWIPYVENIQDEHFFKNGLGYLVAYKDTTTLCFEGMMNSENEYILLDNANITAGKGNGYYLCANPYPFNLKAENIQRESIGGLWLLCPQTGQYRALDWNSESDFAIPSFCGFMAKVDDSQNLLRIGKTAFPSAKTALSNKQRLRLQLSSPGGKDELRVYFRSRPETGGNSANTPKLYSIGSAPDLLLDCQDKEWSIFETCNIEDSMDLRIEYLTKTEGEVELKALELPENIYGACLIDTESDSILTDLATANTYRFYTGADKADKAFILRLYKQDKPQGELAIRQDGDLVSVMSEYEVKEMRVFDLRGVCVAVSFTNETRLPQKGCFIISVVTEKETMSSKIIYL